MKEKYKPCAQVFIGLNEKHGRALVQFSRKLLSSIYYHYFNSCLWKESEMNDTLLSILEKLYVFHITKMLHIA